MNDAEAHCPHDHADCQKSALARAEDLCARHNIRLTPIRRGVLEIVWSDHKAVKAYDILEKLDKDCGAQAPTTVYRALDFLQENGLVHKIESLNAFVGCSHPLDRHHCQFFICDKCGTVTEDCDELLYRRVKENALRTGFIPLRPMLEIHGVCAACA